jgi:hypothetical protein
MKLLPWIDVNKLQWKMLSANKNSLELLKENIDKIDWFWILMYNHSSNNDKIETFLKDSTVTNRIDWTFFSSESSPCAISILEQNIENDKLSWKELSTNPNAIHMLEANPDKIEWKELSRNPNAIHLLEANPDKIDWRELSKNTNAIHLLEANPDKINWRELSWNSNAVDIIIKELEKNTEIINDLQIMCILNAHHKNISTLIRKMLEINPQLLDNGQFDELYMNSFAIDIIREILQSNPHKINWYYLSRNPNAIDILEANPDKINWKGLSINSNAIHLLREALEKDPTGKDIDWELFSSNPSIFYDDVGVI